MTNPLGPTSGLPEAAVRELIKRELRNVTGLVSQLQGAVGGRRTAVGTATLAFAANNDANVTVPHGLGGVPSNVQATPQDATLANSITAPSVSRDATNLTIHARHWDNSAVTMNVLVDWMASI